ncbi:acetylornithine aminotransferase [Puccinia graminis f. sp. tritici]|uniref:Acetylornithine aminotransferase n=1 Tax=Puccinia graminis f. sp. tritici TaxID=56615 RepID=A0A5B0LLF4_PUCGR|nr:acetylornithine aminotransferase [Puccinia graminis f. sp. tritici]
MNTTSRKITTQDSLDQLKQSYNCSILHRFIRSLITHPDHPVPQNVQHRIERWSKSNAHTVRSTADDTLSHGKGCKVWALRGREYLDFTAEPESACGQRR